MASAEEVAAIRVEVTNLAIQLQSIQDELRKAVKDLDDHKGTVHSEIEEWAKSMNATVGKLDRRVEVVERLDFPGGRDRTGHGVNAYRKLKNPDKFRPGANKGQEARWANWSFTFGGYFGDLFPDGEDFLKWARETTSEIRNTDLNDFKLKFPSSDPEAMSKGLFKELRDLLVEGEPVKILKNLSATKQGAEAWRKLIQRYEPRGETVAQSIEERIHRLGWPGDEQEVPELIENLEGLVKEWEDIKGCEFPKNTMRTTLVNLMPERYRDHVRLNGDRYKDYDKVRDFLVGLPQARGSSSRGA